MGDNNLQKYIEESRRESKVPPQLPDPTGRLGGSNILGGDQAEHEIEPEFVPYKGVTFGDMLYTYEQPPGFNTYNQRPLSQFAEDGQRKLKQSSFFTHRLVTTLALRAYASCLQLPGDDEEKLAEVGVNDFHLPQARDKSLTVGVTGAESVMPRESWQRFPCLKRECRQRCHQAGLCLCQVHVASQLSGVVGLVTREVYTSQLFAQ
jgi:hypothetical protein